MTVLKVLLPHQIVEETRFAVLANSSTEDGTVGLEPRFPLETVGVYEALRVRHDPSMEPGEEDVQLPEYVVVDLLTTETSQLALEEVFGTPDAPNFVVSETRYDELVAEGLAVETP